MLDWLGFSCTKQVRVKGKMPGNHNQRAEFKTWHLTCVMKADVDIICIVNLYARTCRSASRVADPIVEMRKKSEKQFFNAEKPDAVSFISLRFSRTYVATWMANATARTPLLDLRFE